MPLPITIPNTFANATATIPLSQLDNNFATVATAVNSIGNGAFSLANVQVTGGTIANVTLDNVSVDVETLSNVTITNLTVDGNATFTNAAVTANTATITTANVTTANVTNMVTGNATITGGTVNVSSVVSTANVSVGDDLIFTGTGNRITGDFSNATVANRVAFQTSTVNGATSIYILPNGTSPTSQFVAVNNSDPTNASVLQLQVNATDYQIRGGITGTGTYLPMTFYTGGSERMRIDTSGNVGIGTSSPSGRLHARWDAGAGDGYTGKFVFSTTDQALFVKTYWQSGTGQHTTLEASNLTNSTLTDLRFNGSTLYLLTGGTERARIDSSGNLLVGTTSVFNAGKCSVYFAGSTGRALTTNDTDNNATANHVTFYKNGTQIGTIQGNGGTGISYSSSSDYRLKEEIRPLQDALSRVIRLKPCAYKWKDTGKQWEGFIAHELAEVVPDAVTGEKDAVNEDGSIKPQGIDTSFLVATLTAAIQELKAELDATKAEVAALKGA